jgi:hypothetical protein
MARMHLVELEDLSWCPTVVRESTTDFLASLYQVFNIFEPAFKKIDEVLLKTQMVSIIDCCSGSGGTIRRLREHLDQAGKEHVTICLTDKYPNQKAFADLGKQFPGKIINHPESVDARQLPATLKGMRTFFSSFHHFTPDQAKLILQNAVDNQMPIGIFESTQRHPVDFIRAFFSPFLMWCLLPFAKRLTLKKILFTYILPITPLTNMWDYFVSNMRTYSTQEMNALIASLDAPGYTWEVGKLRSDKAKCDVPYMVGYKH